MSMFGEPLERHTSRRNERTETSRSLDEVPALYPLMEAWDASQHQRLIDVSRRDPASREAIVQQLSSEVGTTLAEELLDRSLLERMQEVHEHLTQKTYHDIPYIDQELSFIDTLFLAKTFGSPDRIDAFLDVYYPANVDDRLVREETERCLIVVTNFSKAKGFEGRVSQAFDAQVTKDGEAKTGYKAYSCLYASEKDGYWESFYELDRLEFAPEIQSQGIGSKVFSRCLLWCLEQELTGVPVESLRLKANIDVGGYAWSLYGFDFDPESWATDPNFLMDLPRRQSLSPSERRREIAEKLLQEREKHLDKALIGVSTEDSDVAASLRAHAETFLHHVRELLQDDLTCALVTPSLIAGMGLDQPRLCQTEADTFYLTSPPDGETFRRDMHLGKLLLLDSKWHGRLSLQPSNPKENPALAQAFKRLGIPL